MTKRKQKRESVTTGIGRLLHPRLNMAQDFDGNKKFAYRTLFVPESEAELARLHEVADRWAAQSKEKHRKKNVADLPFREVELDDGSVVEAVAFKANTPMKLKDGSERDTRPIFYDSKGNRVEKLPMLGTGTRVAINFEPYLWKNPAGAGVSFVPAAIQLIEVVEFRGGRSFEGAGFEARDDGFEANKPGDEPGDDATQENTASSSTDEDEAVDGAGSDGDF